MTEQTPALRIQQKSHDLFMQYGIRSVSMSDIATQLGISKKTIYQFYADKDQLVDAVVEAEFKQNELRCQQDRALSSNAVHEIFLAIDMMVKMFSRMNPSFIFDMQKYHPQAFQKFNQYKNNYLFNIIRDNIVRGVSEELYRPDVNVDIISRFRVESMMMSFNQDFHSSLKHNMAEIEEELIIHYLFGLVSQKGYKLIIKYQQDRINKA